MPSAASPTKVPSGLKKAQALRMVRLILAHHFGPDAAARGAPAQPPKIEPVGGGLTNLVFSVRDTRGDFIVRLGSDAGKISSFLKEQWAIEKARELGVPTPEVLQVGNEAAPVSYMISRQANGSPAEHHPQRLNIVREMGRYAARINSIRTTGFGCTFEWSRNQLSHNATWKEFLENELKLEDRLDTLTSAGMLSRERARRLRKILRGAGKRGRRPTLNHGDLRLKNVLADDQGKISCILDWEMCTSSLAPEWELSIALHDLSIDEKQEFLEGYGLGGEEFSAVVPVLKAMTIINYASCVHQAAKMNRSAELESYRVRLSGELDLYSL